jgi:enoyl-CoA hydratase/carnithine racemase
MTYAQPLDDEERDLVRLEVDGPIAVITNNRPQKHNAMSDEMDRRLWEVLAEVHSMPELRAIVWRGEGKSFSSGRDTGQIGVRKEDISDLEFIERGHRPTQMFLTMPCPIICALKGWVIGGAFERALLCDIRVAAVGTRMMLPEVVHGVIPDSGGTARLFQMAGHGVVADMALTGRVMTAEEALGHGVVSRLVDDEVELDAITLAMAEMIASAPDDLESRYGRSAAIDCRGGTSPVDGVRIHRLRRNEDGARRTANPPLPPTLRG